MKARSFAKGDTVLAIWTKLVSMSRSEKGASMVEYALLVVLIAIIAIVAISLAGQGVSKGFDKIADSLTN
jgi:pilus assembly protein Flp/PilA